MKLGTKILTTLSAAALAIVGWAVPSAYASDTDAAGYWESEYTDAVQCWTAKGDETSVHGAVVADRDGNDTVSLNPFGDNWPGDHWEALIVESDSGREIYDGPTAGEPYGGPSGGGAITQWTVCAGADEVPEVEAEPVAAEPASVESSEAEIGEAEVGEAEASDTEASEADAEVGEDEASEAETESAADAAATEPSAEPAPTPAAQPQKAQKAAAEKPSARPATPTTYAVCDTIMSQGTIVGWERADKTLEELHNWPYFDWNPDLPNNGCWYETFVCWEITATSFDMVGGVPAANEKLFVPKQKFVMEGDSYAELQDCWDYVPECETETWYQLDRYIVHNYASDAILQRIKRDGLGQEYRFNSHGVPIAVGPEDTPIQRGYQFKSAVGGDCDPPEVTICAHDGDSWYGQTVLESELPAEYIEWTGDPEDCFTTEPSLDGSTAVGVCVDGAPYLDYTIQLTDPDAQVAPESLETATLTFLHPTDSTLDHSVDVDLAPDTLEWSGALLWPGASLDPAAWPGWEQLEGGTYVSVGDDNFGWTRDGIDIRIEINPEITLQGVLYPDASPVCDMPPQVDICVWDGTTAHKVTLYGTAPEGATLWSGSGEDCTPTVEICVEGSESGTWTSATIPVTEFTDQRVWDAALPHGGCGEPVEPTLDGSILGSVCIADSPWISYNISVVNPDDVPLDGEPGDEPTATVTFVNPDGDDYVIRDLPLGAGHFLWPGAEVKAAAGFTSADVDPSRPETFVPVSWPGWFQDDDGDWQEVEDPQDRFAWTRSGVTVVVEVNPVASFTVNYPPATPTCVAAPPEEFTNVLGAPPLDGVLDAPAATPVIAEATYAG